jgi:ATP-binding cassette subfamily C protein
LILDEATSNLDSETENLISETIKRISGNCTVITIAHRLSTVRHANQLYYLEEGEIKGEGTFEELKQENPKFLYQTKLMGL